MAKPIVIESPFAGFRALHRAYLQAAIRDCLRRGETPYASHQMLTAALMDEVPEQRELGLAAGLAMRDHLVGAGAAVAFYVDLGWSPGMEVSRSRGLWSWLTRSIEDPAEWARIRVETFCTPQGGPYFDEPSGDDRADCLLALQRWREARVAAEVRMRELQP